MRRLISEGAMQWAGAPDPLAHARGVGGDVDDDDDGWVVVVIREVLSGELSSEL